MKGSVDGWFATRRSYGDRKSSIRQIQHPGESQ